MVSKYLLIYIISTSLVIIINRVIIDLNYGTIKATGNIISLRIPSDSHSRVVIMKVGGSSDDQAGG